LEKSSKKIASISAKNISKLRNFLDDNKEEKVDNQEFKKLVLESLSSPLITSDSKLDGLRKIWSDVNSLTYSKEDKLIAELSKNNEEKFQVVQDILNTEFIKNREQRKKYQDVGKEMIIKVGSFDGGVDVDFYNSKLSKYHDAFKQSAYDLVNYDGALERELKEE
jgi:hypothetical protein